MRAINQSTLNRAPGLEPAPVGPHVSLNSVGRRVMNSDTDEQAKPWVA